MAIVNRVSNGLFLAGGVAVIGIMAYATFSGRMGSVQSKHAQATAAEVAVFFPDRVDWLDFRRGIEACKRRGLVRDREDAGDAIVVETTERGRPVRFAWHGVRGVQQTREQGRRLMRSSSPPIAYVGSINTVLTSALAEELSHASRQPKGKAAAPGAAAPHPQPVLLVPWATSVLALDRERGPGPVGLLDIEPGRTFRFCLDNQRAADLVVRCLADHEPHSLPKRVFVMVDRTDPYSRDLADAFHRTIQAAVPQAELVEQADLVAPQVVGSSPDPPTAAERRWADAIWRSAREAGSGAVTWVVLPLQSEPAKRLLGALRARATPTTAGGEGPLRVVCGDGLGLEALLDLAGHRAFPLWCVSPSSAPASMRLPGAEASADTQIPAEIVSAIVQAINQGDEPPSDLRAALADMDLPAGSPAAFGRRISFAPSGEREGEVLGHVLAVHPGRTAVLAYERGADGKWSAPVRIRAVPVVEQP
jgi:hypothetical protein